MTEQAMQQSTTRDPIIVVNHTLGIRQYAHAYKGAAADGSSAVLHDVTRLKPGANRIDPEVWKGIEKETEVDVKKQVVSVMRDSIIKLHRRDAIDLANATIDTVLLQAFLSVERREDVKKAIETQLAKLAA